MSPLCVELANAKLRCRFTGKEYIPRGVIEEKVTWEAVKESLPKTKCRQWLPCWDYDLSEKHRGSRKVIATLLLIGRGGDIGDLLLGEPEGPELTDGDLPLRRGSGANIQSNCGEKLFVSFQTWEWGAIDMFLTTQWLFMEPAFKLNSATAINIELSDSCPLAPLFISCEKVTKENFSQVDVYRGALSFDNPDNPACVAIKTFDQCRMKDFVKEKSNLETIQLNGIKNDRLVRHLGICEAIPCIIFPWADSGDLGDFWQSKTSRADPDFLWVLKEMVGLAHALEDLHRVNIRHGDLKPANILCFQENGNMILKITDFGISRAHTKATDFRYMKTITSASTKAYEGPEAAHEYKLSRRYDSWSMGCIILEFVVWLLYDYSALESFLHARDSEYHGYYRQRSGSSPRNQKLKDKTELHPSVDEAMDCLLKDPRCVNTALEDIVKIVRKGLLQIEYKDRLEAAILHQKLQELFERAEMISSYLKSDADPPPARPEVFSLPPLFTSPQSTYGSTSQSTTQSIGTMAQFAVVSSNDYL
jgi:serine/threonine protein kinase